MTFASPSPPRPPASDDVAPPVPAVLLYLPVELQGSLSPCFSTKASLVTPESECVRFSFSGFTAGDGVADPSVNLGPALGVGDR